MRTTKKQVLEEFAEYWKDIVTGNPHARGDTVMKREAFNDFVDGLSKDGVVSDHQAFTWTNPF